MKRFREKALTVLDTSYQKKFPFFKKNSKTIACFKKTQIDIQNKAPYYGAFFFSCVGTYLYGKSSLLFFKSRK